MNLWPWQYLFKPYANWSVPDLYGPLLWASIIALVATIVVYNIRTRQLHRHAIYLQMYEWLLWDSIITFSMMIVYWIFRFDMILVLGTLFTGLGMAVWIRFRRFPPDLAAYERQLAKQRYFSRERFSHPEATIRSKNSRRRRRRR